MTIARSQQIGWVVAPRAGSDGWKNQEGSPVRSFLRRQPRRGAEVAGHLGMRRVADRAGCPARCRDRESRITSTRTSTRNTMFETPPLSSRTSISARSGTGPIRGDSRLRSRR